MQVVCSYGACDELTACPHEVQLTVAIDPMRTLRTRTKATTGNCVVDDHGWLMEERQRNNFGRIDADHRAQKLEGEREKRDCASPSRSDWII